MDRIGKNKQLMGNSITETIDRYIDVWQGSQIFSEAVQKHKENMKNIAIWEGKQMDLLTLKGLVQDKNLLRSLITDTDERVRAGILALGSRNNDYKLSSSVKFSKSLQSMSDLTFLSSSKKIKEIADANSTTLEVLGISNELLTNMGLDLIAFEKIIKKPKTLRGQVKVYTKNLNEAVNTMMLFLRTTMDNLVKSLYAGSDFAATFKANRKIYTYNEKVTGLCGSVTNTNGTHIQDAVIELVNYPSPGEGTFRSSNTRGNYSFKHIDLTSGILRVRAKGYILAEYTMIVVKGKMTRFDILLLPEEVTVRKPEINKLQLFTTDPHPPV